MLYLLNPINSLLCCALIMIIDIEKRILFSRYYFSLIFSLFLNFANLLMMQFDAILETLCNSDFAKKRTLDKNVISTWLLDACRYSIFITDNNNFYKSSFQDYSNYKIPTNLLHSTTIIMKNRKKKIAKLLRCKIFHVDLTHSRP